jgi:hypothetical protein
MSGNCIRSIIKQARERDILLYPDEHGIRESEDIGILRKMQQMPNGDIYVEFRLYDENDNVDKQSIETANKLWAQTNGLAPYTRPREKGFSIEGYIPEDRKDLEDKRENEGIIDDMHVEGFVVVPEPAYENSVIQTVEKSKKNRTKEEGKSVSKVQKTLTPQEEDLLQKINASIAELRKLAQGDKDGDVSDVLEADDEGEPVPAEENESGADEADIIETEAETGEDEGLAKSKVKKSESGRAGAEEKVSTLAPEDERTLAVLKGLFAGVRKSGRVPDATVKYFGVTHKVMKSLMGRVQTQSTRLERQSRRIAELEDAVSGVLEGIGISEKVLSGPERRVQKSRLSPDAEAIVSALGRVIEKSAHTRSESNAGSMQNGGLGDVLQNLFQ